MELAGAAGPLPLSGFFFWDLPSDQYQRLERFRMFFAEKISYRTEANDTGLQNIPRRLPNLVVAFWETSFSFQRQSTEAIISKS